MTCFSAKLMEILKPVRVKLKERMKAVTKKLNSAF